MELLVNAVKFTPAGGRVTVCVMRTPDSVEIAVQDTGQGMSREFIAHAFDRFQQQDATIAAHGGLGLGLAIVRQLVHLITAQCAPRAPVSGSAHVHRPPTAAGTSDGPIARPPVARCGVDASQRRAPPRGIQDPACRRRAGRPRCGGVRPACRRREVVQASNASAPPFPPAFTARGAVRHRHARARWL